MRRYAPALVAAIVTVAAVLAPPAHADAPIGNKGETLRVQYTEPNLGEVIADVTVHDVLPADAIPPGWGCDQPGTGHSLGPPCRGWPWRGLVTVQPIKVPSPYILSVMFTFDGVTPYADAYTSRHTDAPDALDTALLRASPGSPVSGAVYWDVWRGLVTNVVLLDKKSGSHLAQWNFWQPGSPLP